MEPLMNRRAFLAGTSLAGLSWLTPISQLLAQQRGRESAQSIILLWLAGGASQLETFDPHPGSAIAGDTGAVDTSAFSLPTTIPVWPSRWIRSPSSVR
jgi:uncharacterized protein (DUF1501 family)